MGVSAPVTVRLARMHAPVSVLGPGRRVGIWLQGCSLGCRGCMSRDTWAADGGTTTTVDRLVEAAVEAVEHHQLTGVTISGGEPFEQPEALHALAVGLRAALAQRAPDQVDLLVYSGWSWERLLAHHEPVVRSFDAIVTDPFVDGAPTDAPWVGSANQRLIVLDERVADRYATVPPRRLQVGIDDSGLWILGIPRRGDLQRLEQQLHARGVDLGEASWRP